jgi:hypothetical protein
MLKFIEVSFTNIKAEIERFLSTEHSKAAILYSPGSPYGHILSVIENLHQLSFLYLKNSINQFDISDPNSLNERIIRNAAIFAGHNPGRAISSTGTLRFSLKTSIDLEKELAGGRITFVNKSGLKNKTNSMDYSLNIGTERITHKITPNYQFFLPIIQGKWSKRNFTGTGEILQTYQISLSGQKDVENFNIEVLVNGDYWSIKKHIWEMLPDDEACVVRTGFNGGIDIIFGNDGFGKIPPIGSIIEVSYLITDGSRGNIFRRTLDDWKFVDDVIDGNGGVVDPSKIFNISIYTDINFGADKENLLFTKNILPIASNNFVLGLPQQYAYEIKKLGVFSHVNAYEKNGTIFIMATPNIRLFKNQNSDYFSIDLKAFELDNYEKSKIDRYLRIGGNIQLTRKYVIDSPKLSFYIVNIYIMTYSDANDDSVNAEILDKISEYFLDLRRIDRIPKLDIIKELSNIRDVHSIDIQFICKRNEDYHIENINIIKNKLIKVSSKLNGDISNVGKLNPNYNQNSTIGIDPVMGDIVFEASEIPIIRGGWYDRDGNYYSDDITGNGLKSVNIIKKGSVPSQNRTSI